MKSLFFIEIPTHHPSENLSYHWYKKYLTNDYDGCDDLMAIKDKISDCDVILVLPDFNVTQKQIESKLKNRKKLELAIAYQLEEVLSEEIEELFFAYQVTEEKNILDVAIVNRTWFEQWLDIFKQQEIPLTAVITDSILLKTIAQDYLLIHKSDYFLLKTPAENYVIDNENINYFLTKLKKTLPDEVALIMDKAESLIKFKLPLNIKITPTQDGGLKLLTANYVLNSGFNLLQGRYTPKLKNDWQQIKLLTIGLLGLLLIATTFQGYQHWKLTQQESMLEQQQIKIFQDNFPAVKRIINPLSQMKHELEQLKQTQQQQEQFINLLAKVAIALREMIAQEKIHLLGMEFDSNVLIIKANASSLDLIEQVKQRLSMQQLNVETESSMEENQVKANFKISGNTE